MFAISMWVASFCSCYWGHCSSPKSQKYIVVKSLAKSHVISYNFIIICSEVNPWNVKHSDVMLLEGIADAQQLTFMNIWCTKRMTSRQVNRKLTACFEEQQTTESYGFSGNEPNVMVILFISKIT